MKNSLFHRLSFVLLWLTILTIPIQKIVVIGGFGSINKVLGLCLFVVATFAFLIRLKIEKPNKGFVFVYLFVLWNLLSWFWTSYSNEFFEKNTLLLQVVMFAWIIFEFSKTEKLLYHLFQAYVLGSLAASILTIYNFLTTTYAFYETRFVIDGYNANDVGYTLVLAIPLAWFLGVNRTKLNFLYIPISLYAILLTASRSAFLVIIFIFVSIIWFMIKYQMKYRKLVLIALIPLCFFVYKEIPQGTMDRLFTTTSEITNGTLNERTIIWRGGFSVFKDYPIEGVGSGGFAPATYERTGLGELFNAHNAFLSVLVENGLVGFVIYLIFLLIMLRNSWKLRNHTAVRWLCITLFVSWIIISVGDHTEVQKFTWMIFAFIMAMCRLFGDVEGKPSQNSVGSIINVIPQIKNQKGFMQ